jgi:hypothetical protein
MIMQNRSERRAIMEDIGNMSTDQARIGSPRRRLACRKLLFEDLSVVR